MSSIFGGVSHNLLVPLQYGNGIVSALAPENGGTCARRKHSVLSLWLVSPPPIGAWTADRSCATCPGASSTRSEGQGSKQGKWRCIPTRKEVLIKTSIPAAVIVAKGDITCVFFFQRQFYLGQAK